jgi:hypothetical protein
MRHWVTIAAAALIAAFIAAGPAFSQGASPDAMAAARELVQASRVADQFKMLLPMISQQLKPAVAQGRPEVERDYEKIMPMVAEAANERIGQILDTIANVYARNFTADEMRQLTAFYRTPTGQKLLEKTPLVAQQSMEAGNKIGVQIMQDLQAKITDELRKRGHKI